MSFISSIKAKARWRRPLRPRLIDSELSSIPYGTLHRIQAGTLKFKFSGVHCVKNPFDLALYTMLIGETRPKTIVEIGSASGGSALWFAAQCRGMGLNTTVFSVDLEPVVGLQDQSVVFIAGDAHDLGASDLPQILDRAPRPLLVVEDSAHTFESTIKVLEFFDPILEIGEYLIVEDGIVKSLGLRDYQNGPNRAVKKFLSDSEGRYRIDRRYCDFFGYNATWNTDGYLVRSK